MRAENEEFSVQVRSPDAKEALTVSLAERQPNFYEDHQIVSDRVTAKTLVRHRGLASSRQARGLSQISCCRRRLELGSPHLLKFVAACHAELLQQVDRTIDCHVAQFDKAVVRLQIGIQDFSGYVFGMVHHRFR
jgi:hypothetical protein